MSEESILILNMLREGKITAEQADSLLRAVRETGGANSAPPPPPPAPPPTPDPAAIDSMQAKLAELQGKLGDLQGKLGAAQAVKTAGQAASLAGKVLEHLQRLEIDMGKINKAVDEAMRGLNSLKNDALKTARTAARQASQEARKAARDGRRAFKIDINLDFGSEYSEDRPENPDGQPQAVDIGNSVVTWSGADRLSLENKYGRIKVTGSEAATAAAEAKLTKTAWAESESEARILLQQVFLTHQIENGCCKIGIVAPQDARDSLTVDYEITVPRALPLEIATTFGEIDASGVSAVLTAKSVSGDVTVASPYGEGETKVTTASGDVDLSQWHVPGGTLAVETATGKIAGKEITGDVVRFTSRSGDLFVHNVQAVFLASFEAASGDISLKDCSAETRAHVRTQSGHAEVTGLKADQVHLETVSGDADLRDILGTLTVKTVSGDIEANGMISPAVSLLTVSGDAKWVFDGLFCGSFAGTTVSGDLHLGLAADSDTRIEMNTTSGDLSLSLPVAESVKTERHVAGKLGAGTGSLRLQSVSGDLSVAEQAPRA